MSEALGSTIPALERHAVSVSLPTWKDVVDYELGEKRVIGSMNSGYPRFFWHQDVQKKRNTVLKIFQNAVYCSQLAPQWKNVSASSPPALLLLNVDRSQSTSRNASGSTQSL
ncbi:hypothetical protein BT69DRAFT_1344941 [Atractiella rhizophila]|nr:hypothetical protein BT69DRAFT_1344941 [Atractiella rhizophila]